MLRDAVLTLLPGWVRAWWQGIAIDEFPQMDGEYHPCTPSYKGPEKCNPAEHRTPEQAALFLDDDDDGGKEEL